MIVELVFNIWFWLALLLAVLFFLSGYRLGRKRERDKYERELERELKEAEAAKGQEV